MNFSWITAALAFVVVSVAVVVRWRLRRQALELHGPDEVDTITGWVPRATRVLTPAECQAHETLRAALPEYIVLAQVSLARFIKVPTRHSYTQWLRRVGRLCVDLVVCDSNSLVIAVVEIQSATPLSVGALQRQQRVLRVLKAAQIPMHVWSEAALPNAAAAREAITRLAPEAAHPGRADQSAAALAESFAYDETVLAQDAPPSTWFGDLETDATPLDAKARPRERAVH